MVHYWTLFSTLSSTWWLTLSLTFLLTLYLTYEIWHSYFFGIRHFYRHTFYTFSTQAAKQVPKDVPIELVVRPNLSREYIHRSEQLLGRQTAWELRGGALYIISTLSLWPVSMLWTTKDVTREQLSVDDSFSNARSHRYRLQAASWFDACRRPAGDFKPGIFVSIGYSEGSCMP